MRNIKLSYFLLLLLICTLSSCVILKPDPAPDSGFLPDKDKLVTMDEDSPFNGFYFPDKNFFINSKPQYKYLIVSQIITKTAEELINSQKIPDISKSDRIDELKETARYFREKIISACTMTPESLITVIESPIPKEKIFELEISIVELEPTQATFNIFSTLIGAAIPGTGLLRNLTKGSIAFEAIIRDATTKQILVEIKDRKKDKSAAFSIKDFEEYAHERELIDDWAIELAQLITTNGDVKLNKASTFTINPF